MEKLAQFYHTVIDLLRKIHPYDYRDSQQCGNGIYGQSEHFGNDIAKKQYRRPERRVPGRSTRWSASRKSIRAT